MPDNAPVLWLPPGTSQEDRPQYYDQLALVIHDLYKEDPTYVIDQLLELIEDASYSDVVTVINEYIIQPDGPVYAGPGLGGGWIDEDVRINLVEGGPVSIEEMMANSEDIGNRWPDGSLMDEPFDLNNPEHRELMGIPDPE
jgi:hypothetical protein